MDKDVSISECWAPVDGEVEPHQLSELGVAVAQHVGEVVGPVQVGVDGADTAAFAVQVTVNLGGDAGQLSDQVHGVLINKLEDEMIKSIRRRHVTPGQKGAGVSSHNVPHGAIKRKEQHSFGVKRAPYLRRLDLIPAVQIITCGVISRLHTHLPVLGLVDPLRIGPSKVTFTVEGGDGGTELGHGVEVCGEIIQHGDHVGGQRCSLCPLFGNPVHLQGWKKIMENTA